MEYEIKIKINEALRKAELIIDDELFDIIVNTNLVIFFDILNENLMLIIKKRDKCQMELQSESE